MKNLFRSLILFASFALVITGCGEDESVSLREYEGGVFVVNEGQFSAGTGTITWYDPATQKTIQNIFKLETKFAGDVVQSMIIRGEKGIIIRNGDNKVEIVNPINLKSLTTLSGDDVVNPRYAEIINGKAYISMWGPYENMMLVDSYVLVYDLTTNEVVTTIETDEGTENLLVASNKLFAANYNYGSSSTVSVINPTTNTLIDEIELSAGPAGMVADANGKVWVVCTGAFGAENGYLYRINPSSLDVEETITITGIPGVDIAVTPDGQSIIYSVGNSIYKVGISATEEPAEALIQATDVVYLYGLNVDPSNGEIYLADAPSFTAAGVVYRYSATGTLINEFSAGIGPGQFVFVD